MNTALIQSQSESTQLSAYQKIADPLAFCNEVGKALQVAFKLDSPHHGTVMALAMLCRNRDPLEHIQRYHGDGSMRASAIQAEFQSRGGRIEWINIGDDGKEACAKFTHPTYQSAPLLIKYSSQDAQTQVGEKFSKAGSNWQTNPGAMLRAALVRKAIKIIDPGIIGGYDVDFDEFSDQGSSPQKSMTQQKTQEDRRRELLAGTEVSADPSIEVVYENTPPAAETSSAATGKAEQVTSHTDEAGPSTGNPESPTEVTTDDELPVTPEMLQEICKIGGKMPSQAEPGKPMGLKEIADGISKACKVAKPQLATRKQIRSLIDRWRKVLGEK